jgi:hypothetical protein
MVYGSFSRVRSVLEDAQVEWSFPILQEKLAAIWTGCRDNPESLQSHPEVYGTNMGKEPAWNQDAFHDALPGPRSSGLR